MVSINFGEKAFSGCKVNEMEKMFVHLTSVVCVLCSSCIAY